jgi:hypothetical protein
MLRPAVGVALATGSEGKGDRFGRRRAVVFFGEAAEEGDDSKHANKVDLVHANIAQDPIGAALHKQLIDSLLGLSDQEEAAMLLDSEVSVAVVGTYGHV